MNNLFWNSKKIQSLKDKVIIVTGGNSGLGFEDVKYYALRGANVVLASRNIEKGEKAKALIKNGDDGIKIDVMQLDLADLNSIKKFTESFKMKYSKLNILMNNAGIMVVPYAKTKDGFESQFGVNHLGHFSLTGLLFDHLKNTPASRIITITSMAHVAGKMDFNNLMYENGDYSPFGAYARSKLANLLFTYEIQRKIERHNLDIMALVAHPGAARTGLFRHMKKTFFTYLFSPFTYLFSQSAYRGALSGIRAALDKRSKEGTFYGPLFYLIGPPIKTNSNHLSHNEEVARKLWDISEKLTGVVYDFKLKN